jgi:hypothetical protein
MGTYVVVVALLTLVSSSSETSSLFFLPIVRLLFFVSLCAAHCCCCFLQLPFLSSCLPLLDLVITSCCAVSSKDTMDGSSVDNAATAPGPLCVPQHRGPSMPQQQQTAATKKEQRIQLASTASCLRALACGHCSRFLCRPLVCVRSAALFFLFSLCADVDCDDHASP